MDELALGHAGLIRLDQLFGIELRHDIEDSNFELARCEGPIA
jgi:hypothetical protein